MHLFLKKIESNKRLSNFELIEGDQKVGLIQIRNIPSHSPEIPEDYASNIYYEIEEAYRGKSYGLEILRLGLLEAKKLGLGDLILTTLETNIPSKKIIEYNDGNLIGKCKLKDGKTLLKYEIKI